MWWCCRITAGQRRRNAAAQRLCTGGVLGLEAAAHGWGDESAGVGGPTYEAAEPSACGPRRGGAEIPAAGCTAVTEGKGEGADQWDPVGRERKGEGRTRAGLAVRARGERKRGWSSGWEKDGPRAWPTRKKKRRRERPEVGREAGLAKAAGWAASFHPFSFSSFVFLTH
jgi:hypothetical protein